MTYRTILLFGPPGSGKGTWGTILSKMPGFVHVSSGEMFRQLAPSSEIGQMALTSIRKGELVPDQYAVGLWREYMQRMVSAGSFDPSTEYLVLDGLPRTRQQSQMVDEDLDIKLILSLDCPDRQLLVDRLYGRALVEHRVDDANEEIIHKRFNVYDAQTADALSYYDDDLACRIDVAQAPHKILNDICSGLVNRLGSD